MIKSTLLTGRELLGLLALGLVAHALALWLVFPGYYRPLWPHHSDFYIAPALAHAGFGLSDFMHLPRPTGALFLALIGHFGIHGAMLAVLLVVISNLVLLASLIRRALKLPLTSGFFAAFAGYAFLVFAHPYFYRFATYDAVSQFSLFLLLLAAGSWLHSRGQWNAVSAVAPFLLSVLAFLSKETYGLSALAVAGLVGLQHWRTQRSIALIPFLSLGLALLLALWVNHLNGSAFTGAADLPESPYRIDFSLGSLFGQCIQYAREGLNGISTGALLVTVLLTLAVPEIKKYRAAFLLPLIAGALAILPNAALPNHHDAGYTWETIALLYLPFMLLPLVMQRSGNRWVAARALPAFALLGMVLHGPAEGNQWVLEQEARQRRLIKDLSPLIANLKANAPTQRILVTGINFPFSPFDHGLSLRELGLIASARFDVVSYFGHPGGVPAIPQLDVVNSGVHVLLPDEVASQAYDQVWVFRNDGSLVQRVLRQEYPTVVHAVPELPGIDPLVYPPLLDARMDEKAAPSAELGFKLLNIGSALLGYENHEAAQYYLQRSHSLIPDNPYPAYFLGVSYEKKGSLSEALRWFQRAVETDDRQNPNPAFTVAVSRVTQLLSKAE